jgi:hypothetical protein
LSSSCDVWVHLVRYYTFDSYPAFCWFITTHWPRFHHEEPLHTVWMRNIETRFSPRSEATFQLWSFICISYHCYCLDFVHLGTNWVVLRLSQLSNHAPSLPNTHSGGNTTRIWPHRLKISLWFVWPFLLLCQRGIPTVTFPLRSWRYSQAVVRQIVQRTSAIRW